MRVLIQQIRSLPADSARCNTSSASGARQVRKSHTLIAPSDVADQLRHGDEISSIFHISNKVTDGERAARLLEYRQILCLQFENDRRKPATLMKKHLVLLCVVFAVSIALVVVATAIAQQHAAGVSIQETSIQIHPGTKISSDDQKALDAVLRNFNNSLYKIRTYDHGKLVRTQGSLEDARIDQKLVAKANKASQEGISDVALQIGNLGNPIAYIFQQHIQTTPPPNSRNPIYIHQQYLDSKQLATRIAPILKKYSQ